MVEIIRQEGWLDHTIFISFCLINMICLRALLPEQPLQYLVREFNDQVAEKLVKYNLDLDILYRNLTEEQVKQVHSLGHLVNVWTVDEAADGERLIGMGVDFITSNILE